MKASNVESGEMVGKLVSFENSRGLTLDGMLCESDNPIGTVVHVHGSYGNFYQNTFVRVMSGVYTRGGFNFLSFNLSAHDGIAEGYGKNEQFEYVGGAVVEFGTCVGDIAGALRFAGRLTEKIVLQGHSLGCDRVLHYMLETGDNRQFVLLCPCDSYELHRRWTWPDSIEQRRSRLEAVESGEDIVLLDADEYGLRQSDWTYQIPITRRALLSIIDGAPFRLIRPKHAVREYFVEAAGAVYVGGADPLLTVDAEVMFEYFEKRVKTVRRIYVANGDHMLMGCAAEVGREVTTWVRESV